MRYDLFCLFIVHVTTCMLVSNQIVVDNTQFWVFVNNGNIVW